MNGSAAHEPSWRLERRTARVRGEPHTLRLVSFERGWLASVDTVSGPTLGASASPFLAIGQALEPLGVDLAEAMVLAGPLLG